MSADAARPTAAADTEEARIVDAWCKGDHLGAFVSADHAVIESTRSLRGLVASLLVRLADPGAGANAAEPDLLHAFAAIGRAIAEGHGSPTLVAATVDSLAAAVADRRFPQALVAGFVGPARAAVFESYVHATRSTLHDEESRRWEYPACVVPLQDGSVAVAAGHPVNDEEALAGWASRVAHALALGGVRRAVVSGPSPAVAAVLDALDLAGVAATERKVGTPMRVGGGGDGRRRP